MTFTTKIKDEITKIETSAVESLTELLIYIKFNGSFANNKLMLITENASVARRLFKLLKHNYTMEIKLTIRQQKRINKTVVYILEIKENVIKIKKDISNINEYALDSFEEKAAFLKGAFLACGSINDPKTSNYHAEFLIKSYKDATFVNKIITSLNLNSKIIKRDRGYMVYLKSAEEISDFIKIIGASSALFYYEDIRIYRDHRNMVNRLNNCEQANVEKLLKTSSEQVKNINYLKEHDLFNLLDEKTRIVLDYRIKYPDSSYQELAEIISLETKILISKSGINHHFRKVKDLVQKHYK